MSIEGVPREVLNEIFKFLPRENFLNSKLSVVCKAFFNAIEVFFVIKKQEALELFSAQHHIRKLYSDIDCFSKSEIGPIEKMRAGKYLIKIFIKEDRNKKITISDKNFGGAKEIYFTKEALKGEIDRIKFYVRDLFKLLKYVDEVEFSNIEETYRNSPYNRNRIIDSVKFLTENDKWKAFRKNIENFKEKLKKTDIVNFKEKKGENYFVTESVECVLKNRKIAEKIEKLDILLNDFIPSQISIFCNLEILKINGEMRWYFPSNEKINQIGNALYSLKKLKILDLSYNKISQIQYNQIPENVEKLDLSFNNISILSEGVLPENLRILNLEQNKIKNLKNSFFENFKRLEDVNLKGNSLGEIPYSLKKLKSLKFLDLSGTNKIKSFKIIKKDFINLEKLEISFAKKPYSTKTLDGKEKLKEIKKLTERGIEVSHDITKKDITKKEIEDITFNKMINLKIFEVVFSVFASVICSLISTLLLFGLLNKFSKISQKISSIIIPIILYVACFSIVFISFKIFSEKVFRKEDACRSYILYFILAVIPSLILSIGVGISGYLGKFVFANSSLNIYKKIAVFSISIFASSFLAYQVGHMPAWGFGCVAFAKENL